MSSIRKAGIAFYPGVGVSPDLTGLADTFTLKYKKRGDVDFTDLPDAFTEENAGTYTVPLTLSNVGDYIVIIESTDARIENLEGNVLVTAANIDDVNDAVTALQSDMTAIKSQIDVLDEAELNGIAESVSNLTTNVETIRGLITSSASRISVADNDTNRAIELKINDTITDENGNEAIITAVVRDNDEVYISYDPGRDGFDGQTATVDYLDQTDISVLSYTVNAVDSVMEFVQSINDAISGGGNSLSVLAGYTDNLELMLEGKEYVDTTGATVSEADSKGLLEIFEEITTVSNAQKVDLYTKIDDSVSTLQGNITDTQTAITNAIDAQTSTLGDKIDAVKTVVDANKSTLENSGYGLSALKVLIDNIQTSINDKDTDNDDVIAILNDGTNGLEAIKDTIMNKLDAMDIKLDNLGTATGSRIFI